MSDTCNFPLCTRHPVKDGYCISHAMYSGMTEEKEKPKSIAKNSEKAKELDKKYKKIVKEMLAEDNRCELRTPDCTKIAEGLHHMKRRGVNLLNRKYLKRSCNACNLYVEKHPLFAIANGMSISVHKKEV